MFAKFLMYYLPYISNNKGVWIEVMVVVVGGGGGGGGSVVRGRRFQSHVSVENLAICQMSVSFLSFLLVVGTIFCRFLSSVS